MGFAASYAGCKPQPYGILINLEGSIDNRISKHSAEAGIILSNLPAPSSVIPFGVPDFHGTSNEIVEIAMKVLDCSLIPYETGKISLQDRLRGIMQFGFSWISEMKSQEVVQTILGRILDDSFTLIKNLTLPGAEITIPLILVGTHGLNVMYNSPLRGIYRAKEEDWGMMDSRSRGFKPAKPNLVMRTRLMTRAVETYLNVAGYKIENESVLVFTHPGIHVDAQRPAVRVLLFDALERFGARLIQSRRILTPEEVRAVLNALTTRPKTAEEEAAKTASKQTIAETADARFSQALQPIQKRMNFSKRQWILLGAFVILNIIVLILFLFFILLSA